MDLQIINDIISGGYEGMSEYLTEFIKMYKSVTRFEELDNKNLREMLWKKLLSFLKDPVYESQCFSCLSALRILSRDKTNLEDLTVDLLDKSEGLNTILYHAKLTTEFNKEQEISYTDANIEALKLLCNLLYNSSETRRLIKNSNCLEILMGQINNHSDSIPQDIKLFHFRILFLITALEKSSRSFIKEVLNGDIYLADALKSCYRILQENKTKTEEVALSCEILKILFNLYIYSDEENLETNKTVKSLAGTLYEILILSSSIESNELQSNVVNLLTVLPSGYYSEIIPPLQENVNTNSYSNRDMTSIDILLKFLDQRLSLNTDLIESISPIITALIKLVSSEKAIRKYVRLKILPPLKDVMKRPEEGNTLKAKLCKLLTTPLTEVRDLVAEFLFILCKENVNRMVKYTGYGNAAGMIANKGLLDRKIPKTAYSSESDNSDTEEYQQYKEKINPVTGCYEQPKKNPMEGMSEEQKEYEALKLVSLVDKLTKKGIVQPCRIGEDGKPRPIEHVLELQEDSKQNIFSRQESDSD
ncbi:synembryn isoform X2 [Prorops nasuta]|uniref:synembryn isoform X2 n=1 Tax=Prorops nasuta TaxID=863751 RepID=UPI0034CD30EE